MVPGTEKGPDIEHGILALRGVAVGDSLGLVYEGLSRWRGVRLYPPPFRQRLVAGRGFVSDDTAQSAIALAAIAAHPDDVEAFQRKFARGLLLWFLSVPPGIGLGTVRACLRLAVGLGPKRSGVNSAGNGAAMRSAVIGAAFADDQARRNAYVAACATVTHRHPLAIQGAKIVAEAAAGSRSGLEAVAPDWPWATPPPDRGPSGYVVHTVNAAIEIVRSSPDFESAMKAVIEAGGDTDTVGAIVGGILGAAGADIPARWEEPVFGRPGRKDRDRILAGRFAPYGGLLGANLLTLPTVLAHGFRRLFPPY